MTAALIGPATDPPYASLPDRPPSSTTTATTISGLSAGATLATSDAPVEAHSETEPAR